MFTRMSNTAKYPSEPIVMALSDDGGGVEDGARLLSRVTSRPQPETIDSTVFPSSEYLRNAQ